MKNFAALYGISFVILGVLDFIWLTTTGDTLYRPAMGGMMRAKPDMVPAVIFYVLYVFGLTYLVTWPALFGGSGPVSLVGLAIKAGLFGLVAYGTYNLTGLAAINGWPLKVSLIDMAWGTLVTLITASASAFLLKAMGWVR
jgi:uncharacterized membrane protein